MFQHKYQSETLVQDSIHGYIAFASPRGDRAPGETSCERDLIDSPWTQRLRQIHQLQTAWLVYPTAEHSRFQHVLGTTRLAGRVWEALRESFYRVFDENPELTEGDRPVPSPRCVESLLRVAALLHDVGHGPFGHFFDEHFLSRYRTPSGDRLTHETLGAEIVASELAETIAGIRRTPNGLFEPGERLEPSDVAFLIVRPKNDAADERKPLWLRMLRSLFSGLYTVDNMDFVLRDASASGFGGRPFDLDRLLHYSFFSKRGLTIHRKGAPALERFLDARADLFRSVYFHRTVRAIDVALADLFRESADLLFPSGNPLDALDEYLRFTEWALVADVASWDKSTNPKKRELAPRWRDFLERKIGWRVIAEKTISFRIGEREGDSIFASPALFEAAFRAKAPAELRDVPLRFDVAKHTRLPAGFASRNFLYNPENDAVVGLDQEDAYRQAEKSFRICRIYGRSDGARDAILETFKRLTGDGSGDDLTNM